MLPSTLPNYASFKKFFTLFSFVSNQGTLSLLSFIPSVRPSVCQSRFSFSRLSSVMLLLISLKLGVWALVWIVTDQVRLQLRHLWNFSGPVLVMFVLFPVGFIISSLHFAATITWKRRSRRKLWSAISTTKIIRITTVHKTSYLQKYIFPLL